MTKIIEMQILSEEINYPIVQMPGRHFPGIVLQGDGLKILFDTVSEMNKLLKQKDYVELQDVTNSLEAKLNGLVQHYTKVLSEHSIRLPF